MIQQRTPDPGALAFAQRMAARPHNIDTSANARHFHDPPELIQIAFGGRPWLADRGCQFVHRIGLMRGLGWRLATIHETRGINGVRIVARLRTHGDQLYDLYFGEYQQGPDNLDLPVFRTIDHRPGLTAAQLKPAYAEVLGETAT